MTKYLVYNNVQGKATARPIVKTFECDPAELADQTAILSANEVAVAAPTDFDLDALTTIVPLSSALDAAKYEFLGFTFAASQAGLTTITLNLGANVLLMDNELKGFRLFQNHISVGVYVTANTADTLTINTTFANAATTVWGLAVPLTWANGSVAYIWEGMFKLIPTYNVSSPGVNATLKIFTVSPTLDDQNGGMYKSFLEAQRAQIEARLHLFSNFTVTEMDDLVTLWDDVDTKITAGGSGNTQYPPVPFNGVLSLPTETSAFTLIQRMWRREDTIGLVGLAGTIPTMELCLSGSNGNGEFFAFTDGTLICWHKVTMGAPNTASGPLFRTPDATWTYPATYVLGKVPTVFGIMDASGMWVVRGTGAITRTSASLAGMRTATAASSIDGWVAAIGRWA